MLRTRRRIQPENTATRVTASPRLYARRSDDDANQGVDSADPFVRPAGSHLAGKRFLDAERLMSQLAVWRLRKDRTCRAGNPTSP